MAEVIEEWRDIKNYEGHYQVSNLGRVKSLERIAPNQRNCRAFIPEKILKPRIKKSGYHQVALSKNGKYKHISIHVLVAQAFLEHTPDGGITHVDHIDRDKTNNNLKNLQVLSRDDHYKKTCNDMNVTSKYPGVYWKKRSKKWHTQIKYKGTNYYLGLFENEENARNAFKIAEGCKEYLPNADMKEFRKTLNVLARVKFEE